MNPIVLTLIIGAVITPLVSFLKREHWNEKLKFVIAVAIAALVGVAEVVFGNHIHNFTQFVPYWATAFAGMQTAYRLYFKDTKLDQVLTAIGVK